MKLELKHLAPYLPYGVKVKDVDNDTYEIVIYIDDLLIVRRTRRLCSIKIKIELTKLILRPLSDLFVEIETNEKFIPVLELMELADTDYERDFINNLEQIVKEGKIEYMPYSLIKYLFEWHFDVFGLIEAGLAIDINKI